ncbi:MAG: AraC family transcriptional regulator [Planctomycetota bacterium]
MPSPSTFEAEPIVARITWAERSRCEAWWTIGRHGPGTTPWFEKFTLWYIWAGSGALKVGPAVHPLRAGTCCCLRPCGYYPGSQRPSDCLGITAVVFDLVRTPAEHAASAAGSVERLRDADWLPPEVQEVPKRAYIEPVLARIVDLFPSWCEQPAEVLTNEERTASHLLLGVLRDVARLGRRAPTQSEDPALRRRSQEMLRVADFIREHCADLPPVPELAERAGYNVDYFSRLFQHHIGISPHEFAIASRIDRARRLLSMSDMSVKEIAFVVGYHDPAHFSHQFRQRMGVSATEFRLRIRRAKLSGR